ncbi:hypothetical protein Q2T40_03065 [Winogradskyella maritima]|nr:hypothetical protein [Winogradskyella maritima]
MYLAMLMVLFGFWALVGQCFSIHC